MVLGKEGLAAKREELTGTVFLCFPKTVIGFHKESLGFAFSQVHEIRLSHNITVFFGF